MRVYVEVAKCAFRQHLAYRTANLAGLATNAFWGVLRSCLFFGLYQSREMAAAGFDLFPQTIRQGDFDPVLLRPVGVFAQVLAADFQLRRLGRVAQGCLAWRVGVRHYQSTGS